MNEIFPGLMSCPPPCLSLLEGPEAAANNPYAVQIRISPYSGGNALDDQDLPGLLSEQQYWLCFNAEVMGD